MKAKMDPSQFRLNIDCSMPSQLLSKNANSIKVKSQIQIQHLMNINIDGKQQKKYPPNLDEQMMRIMDKNNPSIGKNQALTFFSPKAFDSKNQIHRRQTSHLIENYLNSRPKTTKNKVPSNKSLQILLNTTPIRQFKPQNASKSTTATANQINGFFKNESFISSIQQPAPSPSHSENQMKTEKIMSSQFNSYYNNKMSQKNLLNRINPRPASMKKYSENDPKRKSSCHKSTGDQLSEKNIQSTQKIFQKCLRPHSQHQPMQTIQVQEDQTEGLYRVLNRTAFVLSNYQQQLISCEIEKQAMKQQIQQMQQEIQRLKSISGTQR